MIGIFLKIRQKLPYAVLAAVAVGFTYFFFGVVEIYAGNLDEFHFGLSDFIWRILLIALCVSAVIAAVLLVLRGTAFTAVLGVFIWIALLGYVQAAFLNIGANALAGDGSVGEPDIAWAVADTVIWVISGATIIYGAIKMKSKEMIRTVAMILLVVLVGMQFVGCGSNIITVTTHSSSATSTEATTQADDPDATTGDTRQNDPPVEDGRKYLTTKGLCEVSSGKNIIIFILDRFDVTYYEDIIEKDARYFDRLDGFTYFGDNISTYSRTYPGIASMVTGIDQNFDMTPDEYFDVAYGSSPFLSDLKANGYKIKLFTSDYYSYRDASCMNGTVDNVSCVSEYTVNDYAALVENLLAVSAYRNLPTVAKSAVNVSSSAFTSLVDYNGSDPVYVVDDSVTLPILNGMPLTTDDSENSYILIHLNGCHEPYNIDEHGNYSEDTTAMAAIRGCFNTVFSYIEQLKALGVYDDSTIIITGDHPRARDDCEVPTQPRQTALFVKRAGDSGRLKYSSAQVSQSNLIATLVSSSDIVTANDYGRGYFDIPEGECVTRHHNFIMYTSEGNHIIDFAVNGAGNDFDNWTIASDENIGDLY